LAGVFFRVLENIFLNFEASLPGNSSIKMNPCFMASHLINFKNYYKKIYSKTHCLLAVIRFIL